MVTLFSGGVYYISNVLACPSCVVMACRMSSWCREKMAGTGWREKHGGKKYPYERNLPCLECLRRAACVDHPSVPASKSAFINKERDFHRFGFQFAGVKYRMVSEVRLFCANPKEPPREKRN